MVLNQSFFFILGRSNETIPNVSLSLLVLFWNDEPLLQLLALSQVKTYVRSESSLSTNSPVFLNTRFFNFWTEAENTLEDENG